jgi:transcriptional regulator with XRE-family HTH domain
MGLGEKLAERRRALKLTRLQVALAVEVVESSVKNWETGRHIPKLYPTQMKALCDILQFTLEELAELQQQD